MNQLSFAVEKFELMEISNSELMKVKLWVVSEGQNSHQMEIPFSAIEEAKSTLVGKPIVAKYDKKKQDVLSHEIDEYAVGVVLSEDDISFETDENGLRWLTCFGYIWRRYSREVALVMERDKIKNVSMEIICTEIGEDNSIQQFIFSGITLISVTPAIKNARAEVLEFSKVADKVHDLYKQFSNQQTTNTKQIQIDNTKQSAMNGTWSNSSNKLHKQIVEASNKDSLVSEAYLIHDKSIEQFSSTKFKYPHHVICDGKLVLHIRGLETAFSKAKQQGVIGEPLEHLKNHYIELGLDKENFKLFALTEEDIKYLFSDNIDEFYGTNQPNDLRFETENFDKKEEETKMVFSKNEVLFAKLVECCGGQKFAKDEQEVNKFSLVDYSAEHMFAVDNETKKMSAIPYTYSINEDKLEADFANVKCATLKCEMSEEDVDMSVMMSMVETLCYAMGKQFATDANQEPAGQVARSEKETEDEKETIDENKEDTKEEKVDMAESKDEESKEDPKEEATETPEEEKKEQEDVEKKEMAATIAEMSKKMSDIENEAKELREFKANVLEQEKKAKVEFALHEVSETMPKTKIEEWRNKVTEFASVDAWTNALKAEAFTYLKDKVDTKDEGITRMGLPTETMKKKESTSLWA